MGTPRLGLALGGGAAKGWAHIGLLKALSEAGIRPDVIAGTSIGAVAGGCWAAGHLDELEEFSRSLTQRRVFSLLDVSLSGSGLINGAKLAALLGEHIIDTDIETLPIPFCCMTTELENGNEIWITKGDLVRAMRASYALPGIFKPVRFEGKCLVDGALVNPVPVTACRAMGAEYVIGVSLSTSGVGRGIALSNSMPSAHFDPAEDDEASEYPDEDISLRDNKRAAKHLIRRQLVGHRDGPPGISSVMVQSYNIIQDRIARSRLAGDPPDLLVNPKVDDINMFDFHKAAEAIEAGRVAAQKIIKKLAPSNAKNQQLAS